MTTSCYAHECCQARESQEVLARLYQGTECYTLLVEVQRIQAFHAMLTNEDIKDQVTSLFVRFGNSRVLVELDPGALNSV